tara:strand:+ start:162 stop:1442 length:1281 start_codon:yes stop_codon:yes gene_type:complete
MKKIFFFLGIIFFFILTLLALGLFLIDKNFLDLKQKIYSNYPNIELRLNVFSKKPILNNLKNDYNVKFLPFTQFEKLKYSKIKIIFEDDLIFKSKQLTDSISYKRYNSFFIDEYKQKILITDYLGNTYFLNQEELFSENKIEILAKNIENNLLATRVMDSFIHDNKIFISYILNQDGCNTINVSFAELNYKKLNFSKFYNPNICNNTGSPGRMQLYKTLGSSGILLSTSEGIHDNPGDNTQNKDSIFGKILYLPFNENKEIIFSSGHRVIQGLNVLDNNIIATEHGPRGGDEVNLIIQNQNYGWPIVSLGERYDFKYQEKKITYKKNHKKNNFQEPIFSFIPSIGVSEIINLPSSFSIYYDNHYLISSLNGRSIYFTRFNFNLSKVISMEKVFINNRIRDIKYLKNYNSIILALEEFGEIGILSKN